MAHDKIAVVDFGGQYAHLIAAKVRRLHVLAEIREPEDPAERFAGYKGVIFSGSPALASHGEGSSYDRRIYDLPVPILGFCFGHQEIAKHYGGAVEHTQREYGPAILDVRGTSPIFAGLAAEETVFMSHGDTVTVLPPGFEEIGISRAAGGPPHRNAAIAHDGLARYGFQFHPEVDDTVHGEQMLRNFVVDICGCRPDWTMQHFGAEEAARLRAEVGDRHVFLLASGGVDSTVCAVLLGQALGPERVHLLHVDTGLMRKGESAEVVAELRKRGLGRNLHAVDATETFLTALAGVVEPEKKRRIIGDTFLRVFAAEAARLELKDCLLAQGTIYPDRIETGGSKRADTIKTHHNRVPAVEEMIAAGRVVEPIADLYKPEVRELGESLGLAHELVWRHPFPGPGLGIRLLCSDGTPVEPEPGAAEALARHCQNGVHGALLPVHSVGVKADLRSYEQPVMLWGELPLARAEAFATRIYQDVPGTNRCIVDLTCRGVKHARALAATVTRARLELLREADHLVMDGLRRHGVYAEIWQCPTVLVPLELDGQGRELGVVRPVLSERAMTCRPAMLPAALVTELSQALAALPGVSGVALDVTTKPPGTIEWE
ncbi:MAG: glutamine-hydrolyzing GMP synthase [Polyangiaceae bacterium]|nr:glutamine-hydrolyzing GMP synthase [Polyangiaceae bacterium]